MVCATAARRGSMAPASTMSARIPPCRRLTGAVALAQRRPGDLLMPHRSILHSGRVRACSDLPQTMHIARELCGGQICVTPNAAAFAGDGSRQWLEKFYRLNDGWQAEDRRKLLAFARDL